MAQIMLIFNETGSETSVTNHGSLGNPVVEAETGGGTATFSWNQDAAPYDGYLGLTVAGGGDADMTIVDMSALTMPADGDINVAIGFRIDDVCTTINNGRLKSMAPTWLDRGGIYINAARTTSTYTLQCRAAETDDLPAFQIDFTGLSFSTDYVLSMSIDVSVPQLKAKLDSGSVQTDTTGGSSFSASPWTTNGGKLATGSTYTKYGGTSGRYYYYYEERGTDIAWGDSELASVNSDPTTLDGWPSSGSIIPQAKTYYDLLRRQ